MVNLYQVRLIDEAVHIFHIPFEDAEEVVSDVLLNVVKNIPSFEFKRGEGDFHGWVVTIFRNRIRDFVRHQALTKGLFEQFQEGEMVEGETNSRIERELTDTIIRQYQEEIRRSDDESSVGMSNNAVAAKLLAIGDALERFETWERVLLRCRALDIPYEDIAKYTEKPVTQLKVYHARVKKKFVEILSEYYPELQVNEQRTS